jgi:hypothetical protein
MSRFLSRGFAGVAPCGPVESFVQAYSMIINRSPQKNRCARYGRSNWRETSRKACSHRGGLPPWAAIEHVAKALSLAIGVGGGLSASAKTGNQASIAPLAQQLVKKIKIKEAGFQ